MTSDVFIEQLRWVQLFVYAAVALIATAQWRRRRDASSAWLAAALLTLALVIIAGRALPDGSGAILVWGRKLLLVVLSLFPYFLYRFMATFVSGKKWFKVLAAGLTALVAAWSLLIPQLSEESASRPPSVQIFVVLLLAQWILLLGAVTIRLWRSGRGLPSLVRRRMRTMSLGAGGLALALVVAGEFSGSDSAAIVVQVLALLAAPLLLVGFAPPYMVRASWRRRQDMALKQAELLLARASSTDEVAGVLLPNAKAILGAATATLEDDNGVIIARDGDEDQEVEEASEDGRRNAGGDHVLNIRMQAGRLVVVASPFTPFFGTEELASLEGFAALADLALTRNRLLASQRRLAAIVESSADSIISKSLDGIIQDWNPGAGKMYGYSAEEAIGHSVVMLAPPGNEGDITFILETIKRGESLRNYETKRLTKSGATIDVALTVSPIRDTKGETIGISTIARDITSRKRLENERQEALEEAERANRAKSEFLSKMSHELRTPLNAILGFAQLLELDSLSDEQKDWVNEVSKAGHHLLDLINEVLDIARIESGNLRLSVEPVDAILLVRESISLMAPLASEENIDVSLRLNGVSESGTYVMADRQRLKQVLLNLIANAIKYNKQGGNVEVTFEPTPDGQRLMTHVADSGQGIPAAGIAELFSPFERLGAEGSKVEGTGLGLALSKGLIEAMGGEISVETRLGQGTTLSISLPVAEAPRSGAENLAGRDRDPATVSRTILYIEDNLTNLKLVERIIDRRPYINIMNAMQGEIGLRLARDHQPDLILLDLNLPDIEGQEVLGRLRSDSITTNIPVVVISAEMTAGQVERLMQAGARDCLTKPLEVDRFLEVVDKYCAGPQDSLPS